MLDLFSRHRESVANPSLISALTCMYHLGCIIHYHGDQGHPYPSPTDSHLMGSCIGLLACAAVSCCNSLGELLPLAPKIVALSLRLGLTVTGVKELVDASPSARSWSVLVYDVKEETAIAQIQKFVEHEAISAPLQPYISASGSRSLTISAPPDVLDMFIEYSIAERFKHFKAPGVYGPYHAPHLYSHREVDRLHQSFPQEDAANYVPHVALLSSSTGKQMDEQSLGTLLRTVLEEILLKPISWGEATRSCRDLMEAGAYPECRIIPVATSATQGVMTALQTISSCKVGLDTAIDTFPAPSSPNNTPSLNAGNQRGSKIAIIGMSGRFPEANGTEAFWDLLYKGLDVHKVVPKERWNVDTHVDVTGSRKNTSKVPYGCWINEPGLFDPRFFNMSPREALQADPAQRLALMTAYEALEMAGFIPNTTPSTQRDRVGIFYGMTSDDYREINSGQDIDTYFIPGGNRAFTPGRINYYFKFSGPSVSVDTACSSSLAAIHLACNAIWNNDCDTAITGGVNVLTNPDNHAGLDRGHFLSRTGNCNTFDDGADGYCRADGVGTVLLKRLEDAQADNDPILGIINSGYTNHSAEAVSITRPHVGAQAFIFNKLLNDTNTQPNDVGYVEMHGTGTQAGDAVEMQSVLDVLAPGSRGPNHPVYLGSAKANVGHGESASGVTSLIKVLLMMKNDQIPPNCGVKTKINHTFPTDLAQRNVHIPMEPVAWKKPESGTRKVFLNNFSAAGGNTALLLEDAPPSTASGTDPRSTHLVAVSARSKTSLKRNLASLVAYIGDQLMIPSAANSIVDLAYTTTARRIHHPFRVTAVGSTLPEIVHSLRNSAELDTYTAVPSTAPNVAFIFTGQGAQYTAMGNQLYETCASFSATLHQLDSLVQSQGFPSVLPLVDGRLPVEDLSPLVTQLGTLCLQIALTRYWQSLGVSPSCVIGHSLGDYAALHAAGILTTSDTIFLCGRRAQLLMEHCTPHTHSMLAVKAAASDIQHLLDAKKHTIACINGPVETVVSGLNAHIDEIAQKSSAEGFKSTKLRTPFAFHSAQMAPILDTYLEIAEAVSFAPPKVPFVSSLKAQVITEENSDDFLGARYMVQHCRETVNFLGGLKAAESRGLANANTLWVEIGSHPVCSGMVKATFGAQARTVSSLRRDQDQAKTFAESLSTVHLAGVDVDWKEYHRDFVSAHQVLDLPRYSWELKDYWIPYNGDFCLTKGAAPAAVTAGQAASEAEGLSTTCQRVVERRGDQKSATVVVENNLAEPAMKKIVQGHKVNGAALTPSSLYADIAQTLVDHLVSQYKPEYQGLGINVCDMTVSKPLIAKPGGDQFFRVSAVVDWEAKEGRIEVYSVNKDQKRMMDHASCNITLFSVDDLALEGQRISYLVRRSISLLHEKVQRGEAHLLQNGMVYKLFSALVDYDANYKNIQSVALDSSQHEATAQVTFPPSDSHYHRNPFWIDSFGHLSGFIMNASDGTDSKNQVFVNHGWDSMHCSKKFEPGVTYETYVRMQPWKDSIWAGNVYVFEGEEMIAIYGGVKFQGLARKILDRVLPPAGEQGSGAPTRAPPPVSRPAVTAAAAPPPPPAAEAPTTPASSGVLQRALDIFATEVGLSADEMTDDMVFADSGVDSLLSLTITGRYREELDLDLDSTVFMDYPTLAEFKQSLSGGSGTDKSDSSSSEWEAVSPPSTSSSSRSSSSSSLNTGGTTPPSGPSTPKQDSNVNLKVWTQLCAILEEEIGISIADIGKDDSLADIGMDSLLSITVLGRIRESLDLDLPGEFFVDNPTLGAVQSNPRTATQTLFLFPDGSGSASSYATLPPVSPELAIYGLNCPYMRHPENLAPHNLSSLTTPYVAEIRRRQPRGPYSFGGWSAGGICAFDAARDLVLHHGETVERLLLLDSPFPIGLEKLPPRLYGFFEGIGLFGGEGRKPPEWLLRHFLAFIDSLDMYRAVPLPFGETEWQGKLPGVYLVWAKDGVCGKPGDPRPKAAEDGSKDPKEMLWLLDDRVDLGTNRWDTLVGKQNVRAIEVIQDANHFSMVMGKGAKALTGFIARAMES
ncbi:hypothetical protein FE257_002712 [Aspergillus nanangensis]|uniref:Polyketide synthase n=1 Tax=Aspergillus nanangensis TaxID=2582783 RepID=A0AAD4CCC3_ASPNN|nr:hypothetical protein FE257_002712 [Aspergillus nanangensis]